MGHLPGEFVAAIICKEYGWTFQEYIDQPAWFLDVIAVKMSEEARIEKNRERELSRKSMRGRQQ